MLIYTTISSQRERCKNLDIFDFELKENEMQQIKTLDEDKSLWCAYDDPMIVEYAMAEE